MRVYIALICDMHILRKLYFDDRFLFAELLLWNTIMHARLYCLICIITIYIQNTNYNNMLLLGH